MRGLNREIMTIHVLTGESGTITTSSDTVLGGYGTTQRGAGSSTLRIRRDQPILIDYGGGTTVRHDETRLFVMGN